MTLPSKTGTRYGLVGALAMIARGAAISTGASSAVKAIPDTATGAPPNRIRVAATAACYVRLGAPTEATVVESAAGSGYAPLDTITLAGGTFNAPMVLRVDSTKLASAAVNAPGTGYAIDNVITTAEAATTPAQVKVTHIKAISATIAVGGSGGVDGATTATGTTGTGTKFVFGVTVTGGAIASIDSLDVAGDYTVGPTDSTSEPVTVASGAIANARLNVVFGVLTVSVQAAGKYTTNPVSLTQDGATAPPGGTGATFNTLLFGVETATVTDDGDYTIDPSNPVAQDSTSGSGTGATFTVTFTTAAAAGDVLVQAGDAVVLDAVGYDHIAAIQVTAAGICQVQPIEN